MDAPHRRSPLTPPQRQRANNETFTATKFTGIAAEMASFAALAVILVWAIGSAVLGMSGGFDQPMGVVLMTAGVGADGR